MMALEVVRVVTVLAMGSAVWALSCWVGWWVTDRL
jgi:hypothetical protein